MAEFDIWESNIVRKYIFIEHLFSTHFKAYNDYTTHAFNTLPRGSLARLQNVRSRVRRLCRSSGKLILWSALKYLVCIAHLKTIAPVVFLDLQKVRKQYNFTSRLGGQLNTGRVILQRIYPMQESVLSTTIIPLINTLMIVLSNLQPSLKREMGHYY